MLEWGPSHEDDHIWGSVTSEGLKAAVFPLGSLFSQQKSFSLYRQSIFLNFLRKLLAPPGIIFLDIVTLNV